MWFSYSYTVVNSFLANKPFTQDFMSRAITCVVSRRRCLMWWLSNSTETSSCIAAVISTNVDACISFCGNSQADVIRCNRFHYWQSQPTGPERQAVQLQGSKPGQSHQGQACRLVHCLKSFAVVEGSLWFLVRVYGQDPVQKTNVRLLCLVSSSWCVSTKQDILQILPWEKWCSSCSLWITKLAFT